MEGRDGWASVPVLCAVFCALSFMVVIMPVKESIQ